MNSSTAWPMPSGGIIRKLTGEYIEPKRSFDLRAKIPKLPYSILPASSRMVSAAEIAAIRTNSEKLTSSVRHSILIKSKSLGESRTDFIYWFFLFCWSAMSVSSPPQFTGVSFSAEIVEFAVWFVHLMQRCWRPVTCKHKPAYSSESRFLPSTTSPT
jgi:hypothetical protein